MRTLLTLMKIITKFVYCLIVGVQLMSMLMVEEPNTYNQRQVINTVTSYKGDYDNIQPSYTTPYNVKIGSYQLLIISFVQSPG